MAQTGEKLISLDSKCWILDNKLVLWHSLTQSSCSFVIHLKESPGDYVDEDECTASSKTSEWNKEKWSRSGFIENYIDTTEDLTGWMWSQVNQQWQTLQPQLLMTLSTSKYKPKNETHTTIFSRGNSTFGQVSDFFFFLIFQYMVKKERY